jgi:hypothetical protein
MKPEEHAAIPFKRIAADADRIMAWSREFLMERTLGRSAGLSGRPSLTMSDAGGEALSVKRMGQLPVACPGKGVSR